MTRAEILDCLTDRPCDSCKFHESGKCERWNCVFEEKPDDTEDCEDCISRQAVLDELEKWDWQEVYLPIHFKQILDELPSITPKQKMGHWEWLTEDKYRCSNCNHETRVDECMNKPLYDFCPFCGAKMGVSENG